MEQHHDACTSKTRDSYKDHEAAYLAELRPHGVLETTTAKVMAGIAWKIEEIDHALANGLIEAKEEWVNRELGEWVVKKGKASPHAYPIGGESGYKQYIEMAKGLIMWKQINDGLYDVAADGEPLAYAYLAICDYGVHLEGFEHEGFDEALERDVFRVPNADGTVSAWDQAHEWGQMSREFTIDKVRFLLRYFEEHDIKQRTTTQMMKVTTFEVSDFVSKAAKWFDEGKKKMDELQAAPLPLDLALPEIERARKLQKELTNDLWREKERLDRMRAPSVTIEHAPLLDNLSL